MISTAITLRNMPAKLAAFKQYIERYACTYNEYDGMYSLVFYKHNTEQPYVFVSWNSKRPAAAKIYVNWQEENIFAAEYEVKEENFVHDMNKFIEAIRQCKEG